MAASGTCPTCKRAIPSEAAKAPFRPFCSMRCKMADLGSWLNGSYRISQPISEQELDQGLPEGSTETDN